MNKQDIINQGLFDNWEEILFRRKIREHAKRINTLKRRIKSKKKRKKWHNDEGKNIEYYKFMYRKSRY